jgi:hypothetical protein
MDGAGFEINGRKLPPGFSFKTKYQAGSDEPLIVYKAGDVPQKLLSFVRHRSSQWCPVKATVLCLVRICAPARAELAGFICFMT